MEISKDWTDQERLSVVKKIAIELLDHPMLLHDEKLFDIQERLMFLTSLPAPALEINKDSIINGKRLKRNEP